MCAATETQPPIPPLLASSEDLSFSQVVGDRHGFLTSKDGTSLFYRYWPATGVAAAAVVVLHGIGYHSGPYKVLADALNPCGVDVYGLDARGHGLSQGTRGFVGAPEQVAADVGAMVSRVRKRTPAAKIFMLGDSMGADFVLNYIRHDGTISGLILFALALNLHASQFFSPDSVRLSPYLVFGYRKPVISLVGKRLDESTRDEKFIIARRIDPLAYKNVSFGYLVDVQRLVFGWRSRIAPRVHAPVLLIKGGQDRVVSHEECEAFYQQCAAADKRFTVYPDVKHTMLWDPETPEVLEQVKRWIEEH